VAEPVASWEHVDGAVDHVEVEACDGVPHGAVEVCGAVVVPLAVAVDVLFG
jgi:hypothetical protein